MYPLNFQFNKAALPTNFKGNVQKFFDAMVDRLEVTADKNHFVIGGNQPGSNQGPWLKGGTQWYVWNGSTYIPQDLSASASFQEVFIGPNPPDSTQQNFPHIWLKTAGVTVVGLYYWFGTELGWKTSDTELQPNSIENLMIQDNAVTTEKIQDDSITIDKLAPNIPLSKLPRGGFSRFLRMDGNGVNIVWESLVTELVANFGTGLKQIITVPHGLPKTPNYVRVCLKNTSGANGFNVFDEIDMSPGAFNTQTDDPGDFGPTPVNNFWKANDTNVVIYLHQRPRIFATNWATVLPDPAFWNIKIYAAVG